MESEVSSQENRDVGEIWRGWGGGGEEVEVWVDDKELCFHELSLAGSIFTDPQTC